MAQTSSVGSGSDCPGRMEASPFMAGCVDSGLEACQIVACLNKNWEAGEVKSSDRRSQQACTTQWEAGTGQRDFDVLP